VSHNYIE